MGDFLAEVRAVLDSGSLQSIQAQIKAFSQTPIALNNVTVNTQGLNEKIQSALNSTSYKINVEPVIGGSGAKNSTQSISRAMKTQMTNVIAPGIKDSLSSALKRQGVFDDSVADVLAKDLTNQFNGATDVTIKSVRASLKDGKLTKAVVEAVNDAGTKITTTTAFGKKGKINVVTNISDSFETAASSVKKSTDNIADSIRQKIGTHSVESAVSKVSAQWQKYGSSVSDAESEIGKNYTKLLDYQKLFTDSDKLGKLSDSDLVNSWKDYGKVLKTAQNDMATLRNQASMSSKGLADSIRQEIGNGGIEASISKITAQWQKYQNVVHADKESMGDNYAALIKFQEQLSASKISNLSDDQLVETYTRFSNTLRTCTNDMTLLQNEGQKLAKLTDISSLDNKMSSWMNENTKAAKKYGSTIEDLQEQLYQLGLTQEQYLNIKDKFKEIDLEAAANGLKGNSLWDKIKAAGTQMLGFVSVGQAINTVVQGFKQMYQAVYDIDTAMTNLKKVTDETDKTYSDFLSRSAKSAQELGRNVSSFVDQTATWAKLGYSLPDAEELAKISSVYANVAEVNDSTAVSDMVTAMKAFNIESSDAISIADALNELGKQNCP